MAYYVLKDTGKVISRTNVQRVTNLELTTHQVTQRCEALDQSILNMVSNETTNLAIQSLPADWRLFDLDEKLGDKDKGQSRLSDDQIQEADAIYETDAGYPSHIGM